MVKISSEGGSFFGADDGSEFGFGGGFYLGDAFKFFQQFGFKYFPYSWCVIQNGGDAGFGATFSVVGDAEAVYLVADML